MYCFAWKRGGRALSHHGHSDTAMRNIPKTDTGYVHYLKDGAEMTPCCELMTIKRNCVNRLEHSLKGSQIERVLCSHQGTDSLILHSRATVLTISIVVALDCMLTGNLDCAE